MQSQRRRFVIGPDDAATVTCVVRDSGAGIPLEMLPKCSTSLQPTPTKQTRDWDWPSYTAVVSGANQSIGTAVVEVYDLDGTVDSKLANISTRASVLGGDNVLIGGLIVVGQNPLRVIVRAIGPSLPLPGALGDPTLSLHDGNGTLVVSNDNWRIGGQEAEIIATGIPPTNDFESAIVRNLAPGSYTAIVRGVNSTTGIAVVEAYGLN